jgi:multidrug efflux pump subunit AcrB
MGLIHAALRRPITVLIAVLGMVLASLLAVHRMAVDIFPVLNEPVIYVAQPYGGMSPAQMEGYLVYYYEYNFLYISGIQNVESKSIQSVGLLKLTFLPGTNMDEALAQTVAYVARARAYMPNGTVPPFVMRFDAGSVPIGDLVLTSNTRDVGELDDLALHRVRPLFATLPGVSAPPPFGGSPRTIVIHADPDRLRAYRMSADEVVKAVVAGNVVMPAGSVRIGSLNRITPVNSVVEDIRQFASLPVRTGAGPTVFLRDIGTVEDSSDVTVGYALVNGKRAVYLPITKHSDASTLTVIREVKQNLPKIRDVLPPDVSIDLAFDQSGFVTHSLESLIREGLLGAGLTGLMVLLFLKDWRSAGIIVVTIPFALLGALVGLWLTGQTINMMTLGGLALAVGILVDEATVAVENIHSQLQVEPSVPRAVLNATKATLIPRLLAMFSILAVFVPSFLMAGVTRALFVPLSVAVGFAMVISFLLSSTLVPVLSIWFLRHHHDFAEPDKRWSFVHFRRRYTKLLTDGLQRARVVIVVYGIVVCAVFLLLAPSLGREIFPHVSAGQLQFRMRAPAGTRIEVTERLALRVLDVVNQTIGPENVAVTLGYVGTHPPGYPINNIYLWTSGSQEAVMQVQLKPGSHLHVHVVEERLRKAFAQQFPDTSFSFEPGDIVSQVMDLGSPTPVEVAISGPELSVDREYAERVKIELQKIRSLRDLQFGQALDTPSINVNIDRERAGQLGVTAEQVARSMATATASSRFVARNFWQDPQSGITYQVQVELPQSQIQSAEDLSAIPLMEGGASDHPTLGDVAQVNYGNTVGEYDRYNMQRMVTLTANIQNDDLGHVSTLVDAALERAGQPQRGVTVQVRGQIAPLRQTLTSLAEGLGAAIIVIFLLLSANFQSPRLALVVVSTTPAVIAGVTLALLVTDTSLNMESFMGAIMAMGVAVANAILLVTFAEEHRRTGASSFEAALYGAQSRLRPILMTSIAMIAGMVPLALALGEGAEQTAPLGRAVMGGLIASTLATLLVLPAVFTLAQRNATRESASLDPEDEESLSSSPEINNFGEVHG